MKNGREIKEQQWITLTSKLAELEGRLECLEESKDEERNMRGIKRQEEKKEKSKEDSDADKRKKEEAEGNSKERNGQKITMVE